MNPRELQVWTDGSGTHARGPACIGVVLVGDAGEILCEASEYVCDGTNNVAELRAIRRGLYLASEMVGFRWPVTVYSDSEYAIGSCTKPWTPNRNRELVLALRKQCKQFTMLRFEHVRGHAGIYFNELADWLAGEARRRFFVSHGVVNYGKPPRPRPTMRDVLHSAERLPTTRTA